MTYVGNDRFEGYSMDLIDEISKLLGFKYEFYIVADNAYGGYNKDTKKWNGLVKELLDHVSGFLFSIPNRIRITLWVNKNGFFLLNFIGIFIFCVITQKADMAICDLTITYSRRTAVDFTMPFMTLGNFSQMLIRLLFCFN